MSANLPRYRVRRANRRNLVVLEVSSSQSSTVGQGLRGGPILHARGVRSTEIDKRAIRVAKSIEMNAHPIHQREVETAGAAIFVAALQVFQHPAGLQ
jgi:hypothetical protein